MSKHWRLYILKLEQDKWYVGITTQSVEKRFAQHRKGFAGARWTKKYRPIDIYDVHDLGYCGIERAQKFEGRVTRKYMEQYGDNNVRGGDLTDVDEYVRHFGRFFIKDDWDDVKYMFLAAFTLIGLLIYYIWNEFFRMRC